MPNSYHSFPDLLQGLQNSLRYFSNQKWLAGQKLELTDQRLYKKGFLYHLEAEGKLVQGVSSFFLVEALKLTFLRQSILHPSHGYMIGYQLIHQQMITH